MYPEAKRMEVTSNRFSPIVLKSSYLSNGMEAPPGKKYNPRFIYDYELEFYTESEGEMLLGDKTYPIRKGDMAFRRPGEITQGILPYNCYLICFDLLGDMGKSVLHYDLRREQAVQTNYINPLLDAIPAVFHGSNEDKYRFLFESVFKEFISSNEGSEVLLKSLVLQILHSLYKDVATFSNARMSMSFGHKAAIKKACNFMQRSCHEKISLDSISEAAGLSPFYFHKLFAKTMGITPGRYLTGIRLDRAKEMLANTALTVSEIAYECGFESFPYFCSMFKKAVGATPIEFRNRHSYE